MLPTVLSSYILMIQKNWMTLSFGNYIGMLLLNAILHTGTSFILVCTFVVCTRIILDIFFYLWIIFAN